MSKSNSSFFLILVLVFALFLLPACDSGGGGGATDTSGEQEETTAPPAASDDEYPSRPIELVIPMGAGGSHDLHARAITSVITDYVGAPMTVTLKPGGGGAIGAEYVASAAPDGYTLLLGGTGPNTAVAQAEDVPYGLDSFICIANINYSPVVIAVRNDSPFQTIDDVIEYAEANPGALLYGHSGHFGALHLPFAMLWNAAGVYQNVEALPFDGGGPALTAMLAGDVDVGAGFAPQLQDYIESGELRGLGVTDSQRMGGVFADIPTLEEQGYDVKFQMWRGVMAPAGTPENVVNHLREAFAGLVEDPTFISLINRMEEDVIYMDGPEFREFWESEYEALRPVIEMMLEVDR